MKASLLLLAILMVALWNLAGAAAGDAPKFKITSKKADDIVTVLVEKNRAIFDVKSPFGISQATIERTQEKWPETVVLRLHLKGLENFKASNDKESLHAAVSAGKVRLWKDNKENAPLDEKSPFWMVVRSLTAEGKPTAEMPLQNGYFEMTVPKAFFAGNPKTIALHWIDFYRG